MSINSNSAARQEAVLQQSNSKAHGNEEAAIQQIKTDPQTQVLLETLNENDGDFEITKEVMEQIMKRQEEVHQIQGDSIFRMVSFIEDRLRSMETRQERIENMLLDLVGGRTPDAARISQSLTR